MNKRVLLAFLAAAMLCLLCSCTKSYNTAYEKALKTFGNGDYAEAAEQFDRLGDYGSAPVYAAYCHGLVLFDQGQFTAAEPYFEFSKDLMYGKQRYAFCHACAVAAAGEWREAAEQFEKLGDFDPAPRWKEYCIGRAAEEEQDYETALYAYEAAAGAEDAEDRLYNLQGQLYNRAIALRDSGDFAGAITLFGYLGDYLSSADQAVELLREYRDSLYEQADALAESGDAAGAYAIFKSLSGYRDAAVRADELAHKAGETVEGDNTRPYQ